MCGRHKLCVIRLFIYISMLVAVICEDAEVMNYTSYEGGKVIIRCPYNAQFINNTKYLCRGTCPTASGDVQTGRPPDDLRFSLNDEEMHEVFTVTITDLTREDGGQYWCAVNESYSKILLSVKNVSHVSGVKGEKLSIKCHYDQNININNDKFFCRGDDLSTCETNVKVVSNVSNSKNTNSRFSLIDDTSARVFTVTISDLTVEDTGIYWCGNVISQHTRYNWISAVSLTFSQESATHKTTTASFNTTKPASSSSSSSSSAHPLSPKPVELSLIWIITLLVTVMLMLSGFLLFVYFKRSKKNKGLQLNDVTHHVTAENLNDGQTAVCDYEEIQLSNDRPDYSLVLPVSGECEASVYALAQNISSDSLQYSTVRFTDISATASHDGQTTCDYATVCVQQEC